MPNLARTTRPLERVPNPGMLAEVAAGLAAPQKELSPKYFYDQRGSELFEAITRLPEYYPTRTERALLATGLAELYVPIDVSATFLSQTASQLRREYPGLAVEPAIADISVELNLPRRMPRPALFAFLGGTIGNFYPPAAIRLLARVRAAMGPGDRFLMGVDLRKDIARIEAAYNDSQGVTAEFNRNMLLVLNHELGADFDPRAFEHRAFYDTVTHRIEMHLVSSRTQVVEIPGLGPVPFAAGESIRTEISTKYDRASVSALFDAAGLRIEAWPIDPATPFGLVVGAPE